MRITGLATGLDMDEVIRESMKPYRVKIQVQQQKKEITEIKQQLYRDVLKDSREFYNKYFDVAKSDSILLSKNWNSIKFESSDSSIVSVSSSTKAVNKNYTVTGNSATASKATITEGLAAGEKLVINGKEYTLKGSDEREIATNLNKELSDGKAGVTVKYTDMAGDATGNKKGFIFESTTLGKEGSFTIGGSLKEVTIDETKGTNATKGTISGITIEDIKNSTEITVGGKTIVLDLSNSDSYEDSDYIKLLNDKLSQEKIDLKASVDKEGKVTLTSTVPGEINPPLELSIKDAAGVEVKGTFENGKDATALTQSMNLSDVSGSVLFIDGKKIEIPSNEDGSINLEGLNKLLKDNDIKVCGSIDGDKLLLTATEKGDVKPYNISVVDEGLNGFAEVVQGKDANIVIKDSKGGVYTHTGNSNTLTLDGITFRFDGEIPEDGIKITGKQDITETKDMIVNFVNDYNELITKLNTLTSEKRDKNYQPLTEEQKKEMSEGEIKLWEDRVKKGQLSRDGDLSRITNALKSAMTTMVEGAGLNLEKIGIKPVADYGGVTNGTFTIDEGKLTEALENDMDSVMKMFIGLPESTEGLTENEKYSKTGMLQRVKNTLYNETVTISSRLIKKAGFEGTSSVANNELSKSIESYEKRIKDMEKTFAQKEQALYSKYASLEVMMNKLNSQQAYLMSQLGMG